MNRTHSSNTIGNAAAARTADPLAWRTFVITLALAALVAGLVACKSPAQNKNGTSASSQKIIAATPPFSTKEPDQFQATTVVTVTRLDQQGATPERSETHVARSGVMRRSEFSLNGEQSEQIALLELPSGTFVLNLTHKLYAQADEAEPGVGAATSNQSAPAQLPVDLAPIQMLKTLSATGYEKLGMESVNGRAVTKYRVTDAVPDASTQTQNESFVWVDNELGFPIRMTWTDKAPDGSHSAEYVMDVIDLKTGAPDPALFAIPSDYRKVSRREVIGLPAGNK